MVRTVKIAAHLRDMHSYSLAESVARAPWEMIHTHDDTHRDHQDELNHWHDGDELKLGKAAR